MNPFAHMTTPLARRAALAAALMAVTAPAFAQTPEAHQPAPAAQTAPVSCGGTWPLRPRRPEGEDVIKQARAALGGEAALAKVQSLTVTGSRAARSASARSPRDVTLDVLFPDKYKRTEDVGIQGGPSFTRVSAVNGGEVWDDSTNRGGGGFRFGGPGGPGGAGAPGGRDKARDRDARSRKRTASGSARCRQRRMKGELARYALIWLLQD